MASRLTIDEQKTLAWVDNAAHKLSIGTLVWTGILGFVACAGIAAICGEAAAVGFVLGIAASVMVYCTAQVYGEMRRGD